MKVIKRDGRKEEVRLSKIQTRLKAVKKIPEIDEKSLLVETDEIAIKVVNGLYDGVTTTELDELSAETAAGMTIRHTDYDKLAARIEVSALHKVTSGSFSDKMSYLSENGDISKEFADFCEKHKDFLNNLIDYNKDYLFSYFGFQTLKKAYLLRDNDGKIVERPQDMWLRVSAFIHFKDEDLEAIEESYRMMSDLMFTHATPTLFNAGSNRPQLSSCFLLDVKDDSIEGIYDTLKDTALISKSAGGIGLSVHKIRSEGSKIRQTGKSDGLVPMLKVFNETARYVNQEGKRKGSFAIYLEPWHADIYDFLDLKKNHGKEERRARDLFYALWIPDLFMQRVKDDGEWTLFDPKRSGKLSELSSSSFYDEYTRLERMDFGRKVKARDLWNKILENQIETGTPYMLYKDAANLKSNQQNLGTIKSSNLCAEIIEYTDEEEQAVCNLASIGLSRFVVEGEFDYKLLYNVCRRVASNLDNVISINFYPTEGTRISNERHRPIGIGVQGLADVFAKLKIPFDSDDARIINRRIFEVIYKASLDESISLAKKKGAYPSYEGSPLSSGKLQMDLWGCSYDTLFYPREEWEKTRDDLLSYGARNSLSVALMPTASTSQILGNNECFEPFNSNIYSRRTLSGEFYVVNKYLVEDLEGLGLWDQKMINTIIKEKGSVQRIDVIPKEIKDRYKTAYEMSMKSVIDLAADRGPFVCQSQSMNLFVAEPNYAKLSSMHFYAWEKGLKTGMYYLRTKPATNAISGLGLDTSECLMCSG